MSTSPDIQHARQQEAPRFTRAFMLVSAFLVVAAILAMFGVETISP